jgi:hypothetical protein
MILTGGNQRTQRKTCPNATLSTTDLTWIIMGYIFFVPPGRCNNSVIQDFENKPTT